MERKILFQIYNKNLKPVLKAISNVLNETNMAGAPLGTTAGNIAKEQQTSNNK